MYPPCGYLYGTTAPYPPPRGYSPLTSPSGALGALAKSISVTGITAENLLLEYQKRIAQAVFARKTIHRPQSIYSSSYNPTDSLIEIFALPN
jgi:hypothetical protein